MDKNLEYNFCSLIFLSFNILSLILIVLWTFLSSNELKCIHFLLGVIFVLADEDHDLASWEVTNQLLLSNLEDQLDQVVTFLFHELGYFVSYNSSDQVHLPNDLAVSRTG